MASVLERLKVWNDGWVAQRPPQEISRGGYNAPLGWDAYQQLFTYNNNLYPFGVSTTLNGHHEPIGDSFSGLVAGAYKSNGVVFACMVARMLLFSEARFQFRTMRNGRPGPLFGTAELAVLENPSPGDTTGDLLSKAIQDADLSGNWFGYRTRGGNSIIRLRPDWVEIVIGSNVDAEDASLQFDAQAIGYLYFPGGRQSGSDPMAFLPDEIAHFKPIPDPAARFRGMSWLTPIIRELEADNSASAHKLAFFQNGATSNAVVKLPDNVREEAFRKWVEKFEAGHSGVQNAYKTIYLGGGADMTVVGADFEQMDFKTVQGAGETRIAAAARIHPVIVGLSEGLQGSSLNAGNFNAARRLVADGCLRPLWRNMAGSLERIIQVPPGSELWYDDRDISFLQEDLKDRADTQVSQASAAKQAIDAGYDPQSVVDWLASDDITQLNHTGLVSVQLQEPGVNGSNGSGPAELTTASR